MRYLFPAMSFAFVACGGNEEPTRGTGTPSQDTTAVVHVDRPWPGYYEDTLACSDCEGLYTQLWIRSDSTFVSRVRALGKDSLASGTIGTWSVAEGTMTLKEGGTNTDRFKQVDGGLQRIEGPGLPTVTANVGNTLERLADELQDEIPRMRMTGIFIHMADAMSFKPCGSERSWPSAGAAEWTEEGELIGSLDTRELQRRYRGAVEQGGEPWTIEVECSLAMGPAMEGDGADEYIFIHRVLGEIPACL